MTQKNKADVRTEVTSYPIFHLGTDEFLNVVEENLKGEVLSANDLMQIRLPTGGGQQWSIPSINGTQNVAEFEGIILHQQMTRSFWKSGIEHGSSAPDCQSNDGKTGVGSPGGNCKDCPNSQYGSKPKSKTGKKACRQMKSLFLLLPESYLPVVLILPPSSLQPMKNFIVQLSNQNISLQNAVVSFGLEKSANKANIPYSRATFNLKECLTEEESAIIVNYANALKEQGSFEQRNVLDDLNGGGE